jgi:MHS family alpha-ketoglutarate permease-like MFS transporter
MRLMDAVLRYTPEERKERIFAILGASSGNLVEWFDFYVYAFCAIYFAGAFFPKSDPTVQLLNTAGVFAAGFLMRPIGSWIFGRIADRKGRKTSMLISVLMMCAGSLFIAFLPTYETIGTVAPVLLLLARMFQGVSVGGEYGTTATYMSEVALKGQRGFFASFQYVTLIGGQLLAVLLVVILQQLLTDEELRAWGWRIPFVVGAIAAIVSLYLRRSLNETARTEDMNREESGTISGIFKHHKAAFVTVVGYTAGGSLIFYTFTTYMQKYLVNTSGMEARTASAVMTCALLAFMVMQPLFGMLSDRIGRRMSMMLFGSLGAIGTWPLMTAIAGTTNPFAAFGLIIIAMAIISFYTSIAGLVKAEMFPPEVRALGVGLSYAIANAVFGGSAEYAALGLKSLGAETAFYWYVSGMMLVAFFVSMRLPRQASYLHHDH